VLKDGNDHQAGN